MSNDIKDNEVLSSEVVESYIFTTVRHNSGIYSERLLLRLVALAQCEISGLDFKGGTDLGKVEVGPWGYTKIIIPVKDLLSGESDTNYTKAKEAVRGLMGKFLEYEDNNVYKATSILNDVDLNKESGKMVIKVNENIWKAMLDFSKGFRKYELEVATRLKGKYSLRLYKLISKQTSPLTYSIEELRKMWGLEEKYKRVDDFVKNTIKVAKEELDHVSPYSFDFVLNYAKNANKTKRGRPVVTSITFHPIHNLANESPDTLRRQVDLMYMLDPRVKDVLRNKFQFDDKGIKANITILDNAYKEFDLFEFLCDIAPKALRANNVQGYVISAIKTRLKEEYGVMVDGRVVLRSKAPKLARFNNVVRKEPMSISDVFKEL